MTDVTIAGSNLYSGTYDDPYFWILGGANNGGHDDADTISGDETFVFGNLQYRSNVITDTNYSDDSGTLFSGDATKSYQVTASGTSNDTLHFSFTFHEATPGGVLGTFTPDPGSDGKLQQNELSTEYSHFLESLGIDPSIWAQNSSTDPLPGYGDGTAESATVYTGPTNTTTRYYEATPTSGTGTPASLTADYTGAKTLLGFSVGSDHIGLDGVTQDYFNTYFNVASTTHTSANNNTVNDTVISLGDGTSWQVDLLGVDTTAIGDEQALKDYVWANIIAQ